jgi:uncharacterized protein DUF4154
MNHTLNQHVSTSAISGARFAASALRRVVRRAKRFAGALILGAGLLAGSTTTLAADDAPLDFQVKAAFLVNFPKYVDWPSTVLAETNSPITVAIFGDDNVAGEFSNMIKGGRTVSGRPVQLKRITKEEQIGADCHILFIAGAERLRIPAILEKVKGTGILTVGENEDFLEKGGIVNLVHRDRKIRLQINLDAARESQLKISTRLLIAADAVKGKRE